MTLTAGSSARIEDAKFGLEIRNERWGWSSDMFDTLGISKTLVPSTDLVLACKHPGDRLTTKRLLTSALTYRGPFCFQNRNVRSDGHLRKVETTGTIAAAPDGSPRALIENVAVVADWAAPIFEEPLTGATSEGELAVALLAHIEEAHAYVFRHYASIVAQASRSVLHHRGQVDDVVQSVFEGLWRHPARFDPTRGSLAHYLKLGARTRSIDVVRSESARSERSVRFLRHAAEGRNVEDDVIAAASNGDIRRTLHLLPERERKPIELAYFGGSTYRMVAAQLGLPEGTVKSRIRSGLAHLRDLDPIRTREFG
jgi:RNA polymerase sigma-70 factor (ECF subfamily)